MAVDGSPRWGVRCRDNFLSAIPATPCVTLRSVSSCPHQAPQPPMNILARRHLAAPLGPGGTRHEEGMAMKISRTATALGQQYCSH